MANKRPKAGKGQKRRTPADADEALARRIGGKPIANENATGWDTAVRLRRTLAPFPAVDRWPTILGSNLTIAYLSATYRICQNGYRQQFVDALDELLEKDSHAQCVLTQRTLAANGAIELVPAQVPDAGNEKRVARAGEIAAELQRRVNAIPARTQALSTLLFSSIYYGIGASEIHWERRADGWWVTDLAFVHSRRIAYPDQNDWSAHIWDQGAVTPAHWGMYPTERLFGLRVEDYPGKFLFHKPSFRADYPTRDGLGRVIAWMMCLKLIAFRGAGQFVERFGKPWVDVTYTTAENESKIPRAATQEDITQADAGAAALGSGSDCGIVHPDSIKIDLKGPGITGTANAINHEKLIDLCNSEISKAVRGGTLTTEAGEKGARSLGEVHEEGDVKNARFDAACLADTLKSQLVWWLCHLNFPGEEDLCPDVKVHVEQISPEQIIARAKELAGMGARPDGRKLAAKIGIDLIDPDDPSAVPLAPLKPVELFALAPAASRDVASTVSSLAAMVGVELTPALQTAVSEMEPADVARLLQSLIGAAKANQKAAAATGVAGDSPTSSDEGGAQEGDAPDPTKPPAKKKRPRGKAPEDAAVKPGGTESAAKHGAPKPPAAGAESAD